MANETAGHYPKSSHPRHIESNYSDTFEDVPGGGRTSYQSTTQTQMKQAHTTLINNKGFKMNIHERFKFVRKLEDTHFGSVWEGYDLAAKSSDRSPRVAVKESKRDSALTKTHCRSLKCVPEDVENEIKIHKMIMDDPNCPPSIIKLNEVITSDENIFMIMEFGDGGSLLDYLQKQKFPLHTDPLTPKHHAWKANVRRWFRDLCEAVRFMHDRNITHKDLSLQNILLKNEDMQKNIKIVDFGLAELFPIDGFRRCMTRAKVGKSNFASAECYSSKVDRFDAKSNDCWCLGVILFMCLTQCSPYENPLDDNARTLHRGAKYIRRNLQRWRKSHLVDDMELDLLAKIFRNENDRFDIYEILKHTYLAGNRIESRRQSQQHRRSARSSRDYQETNYKYQDPEMDDVARKEYRSRSPQSQHSHYERRA